MISFLTFCDLINATERALFELHRRLSITVLSLHSSSYYRVRSLFHVLRQSHPLDVECHGPRAEEPVVDVIHLLDSPSMGVVKNGVTLCIEARHVSAGALSGCPYDFWTLSTF